MFLFALNYLVFNQMALKIFNYFNFLMCIILLFYFTLFVSKIKSKTVKKLSSLQIHKRLTIEYMLYVYLFGILNYI